MKNNKYFILCVFIISMCSLGGCSNSFKAINSYSTGIPTDEAAESIISATVISPTIIQIITSTIAPTVNPTVSPTPVIDVAPTSAYPEVPTDKAPPQASEFIIDPLFYESYSDTNATYIAKSNDDLLILHHTDLFDGTVILNDKTASFHREQAMKDLGFQIRYLGGIQSFQSDLGNDGYHDFVVTITTGNAMNYAMCILQSKEEVTIAEFPEWTHEMSDYELNGTKLEVTIGTLAAVTFDIQWYYDLFPDQDLSLEKNITFVNTSEQYIFPQSIDGTQCVSVREPICLLSSTGIIGYLETNYEVIDEQMQVHSNSIIICE